LEAPDEQATSRDRAEMLAAEADEKICNIVHLIYNAKSYEGIPKDYKFLPVNDGGALGGRL
jgi:NTE family protein